MASLKAVDDDKKIDEKEKFSKELITVRWQRDNLSKSITSIVMEKEKAWKTCKNMHASAMAVEKQFDSRPEENAIHKYRSSSEYKEIV